MATNGKKQSSTTEVTELKPVTLDMVITELRVLNTADRLLGLYELGIDGCASANADQVHAVLEELISALDFEYEEIAQGFNRLYTYCLEQTQDAAFDRVGFILQDLRNTLVKAVTDEHADAPLSKVAGG